MYNRFKEKNMEIEYDELKKDLVNLLENYWYAIRTRDCSILRYEQNKQEEYCKELMRKYKIN